MANAGEKQSRENYAENFPAESESEDFILTKIKITETVISAVEIKPENKRDFTNIYARLKNSARKKSISIF